MHASLRSVNTLIGKPDRDVVLSDGWHPRLSQGEFSILPQIDGVSEYYAGRHAQRLTKYLGAKT